MKQTHKLFKIGGSYFVSSFQSVIEHIQDFKLEPKKFYIFEVHLNTLWISDPYDTIEAAFQSEKLQGSVYLTYYHHAN